MAAPATRAGQFARDDWANRDSTSWCRSVFLMMDDAVPKKADMQVYTANVDEASSRNEEGLGIRSD